MIKIKNKTKKQLINELVEMHKRLVKYETSEAEYKRRKKLVFDTNRRLQESTQELFMAKRELEKKNKELEIAYLASLRDITERKRSEEKIRQIAEEWSITFGSIADLVSIHDKDFKIIKVNKAFANAFRTTPEELVGKFCYEITHKTKEPCQTCPFKQTLKTGKPATEEFYEPRLGTYLQISISPIFNESGEITSIVHIAKDITERKKIEKLKDEFISTVSHELRTPLSIIKEGISLVLDEIPGKINEKQKEILITAKDNIDRLARIINSLLDISKIEAGKMELKRGLIDITSLIRRVISSFESKAKEKSLQLSTSFSQKRIDAYVDTDRITQVFTNLVGNALKFTTEGFIEISTKEKENEVECTVADTGIGISKEDLPKVFNRFQQFGRSAGAGEKGTGLGLSIAKEIIKMHNGKIWVESPPAARLSYGQGRAGKLDQGTKVTFTLPKYTVEEVLSERIGNRILTAKEEHKELSVFIINLENYSQIQKEFGKRRTQKIFLKVFQALKNAIRNREPISLKSENEFVVLAEVGGQDALRINERLNRAIKESIFEVSEELEIDFSYGYATYPDDAGNGKELLGKACKNMVNERKERLKKSILVVDDEPKLVKALQGLLEKLGYNNLKEAYDGDEALRRIESEIPDLIILDMRMPEMNGYEVIGRLKENVKTKDIPILILSAYEVEINKLDRYTKKKAIPVLGKPVDKGQLEKLVNYLL